MKHFVKPFQSLLALLLISGSSWGQSLKIDGKLTDAKSGEPIVGATVSIKDRFVGTISDVNGEFSFTTDIAPPFRLFFSHIGYKSQVIDFDGSRTSFSIQLEEETILGQEVVVSASRFEEGLLESPVSIEKIDLLDIRQNASQDFYDKMATIKGVDMNRQSLTFKMPNTRGFNGNTNYRLNQLVDGIDNAPAGLGFAAGNIFGLNQLDVESVELLVGASSALYGPGGMNGTLLMTSKNPFDYQGVSVYYQTGLMHVNADYRDTPSPLHNVNLRYAKAINDKWAFKINAGYLSAIDWHATDYRDRTDLTDLSLNEQTSPSYDGVNVYGDEVIVPVNLLDVAPSVGAGVADAQGLTPGTPAYDAAVQMVVDLFPDQIVTRTGYREIDLVDYDTKNASLFTAVHHRINSDLQLIAAGGFGTGTSVYTAQNRFSLVNFRAYNARVELQSPNYFLRVWMLGEDAGDTYDAGTSALLLNEAWKSSEDWYTDYIQAFSTSLLLGNPLESAYRFARKVADNREVTGAQINPTRVARPLPGSPEFIFLLDSLRNTPIQKDTTMASGSLVVDKTKMYNIEGMYNFSNKLEFADLLVGFNHRIYNINTDGSVFFDRPGDPIIQHQFGAFVQIGKRLMDKRLKLTGSARYDKNEKFEGRITPRGSFVYSFGEDRTSNLRGSVQTAFRFPPISDQWVDLDVGRFQVVGGNPEVQNTYFQEGSLFPLEGLSTLAGVPDSSRGEFVIPKFRPERVVAFELGYKGLLMNGRMLIDVYGYVNTFNGFIARQDLIQYIQQPTTLVENRFQTTISTNDPLTAAGWAAGIDYRLPQGYVVQGNVAYNSLESVEDRGPGFRTGFNSPEYRFNLGISHPKIKPNLGFNIVWHFQQKFLWESEFGVGEVPAYHTLDAQVTYAIKSLKTSVKLGASNLLNDYYTTGFGNPQIGGIYYIAFTFDELLN